ncbi:hypothetical protein ACFSHQ_10265 [Gemmobacter lanyuensis]
MTRRLILFLLLLPPLGAAEMLLSTVSQVGAAMAKGAMTAAMTIRIQTRMMTKRMTTILMTGRTMKTTTKATTAAAAMTTMAVEMTAVTTTMAAAGPMMTGAITATATRRTGVAIPAIWGFAAACGASTSMASRSGSPAASMNGLTAVAV